MGGIFGSGSSSTSQGEAKRLKEQEALLRKKEAVQAKELASRRKVSGRGSSSRTLFSQVLGTDEALGKKVLGE